MKRVNYFDNAWSCLKLLKDNSSLYIPDLSLILMTAFLSYLFLYFNDLTHIFTGEFDLFEQVVRSILDSSSLLFKFIISLVIIGVFNLIFGLGTVTMRYSMVSMVIKKTKINFKGVWDAGNEYIWAVLGLKATLLVLYLIPAIVLFSLVLLNRSFLIPAIILVIIIFFFYRFILLFSYPILFLKDIRNPIEVVSKTFNYFRTNKLHTILTGLFIILISTVIGLLLNGFLLIWGPISSGLMAVTLATILSVIFVIIKQIIDITVSLWANLFIFKNY
ncbi:hypothetical protein J4216_02070 [Candidatus Woesearchaeota archaeon]|nr:hypothetical protein [Candidatus Woesearchaeota archaeon]